MYARLSASNPAFRKGGALFSFPSRLCQQQTFKIQGSGLKKYQNHTAGLSNEPQCSVSGFSGLLVEAGEAAGGLSPAPRELREDGCPLPAPPRAPGCAAAPLRRLTRSPSRLPARLPFAPPPLPETLGVEAGACAVRWQPGALAQSPAGRPPPFPPVHPGHRTPARTAGPLRCLAARSPSPSSPLPPARAAPALSPSALPCAGLRPRRCCRCLRPSGGRRRLRLPLPSASPSAGRLDSEDELLHR